MQDIYLRKVEGNEEQGPIGVAVKALADPARGCKLLIAPRRLASCDAAGRAPRAASRGRPPADRSRMDLATFLVQCLNAVQYGLLLFLVASGLTLIFGIMGVINLAHGSFYMIGAYLAFALAPLFGD